MQFDENGDIIVPGDYKITITISYDEKPGIQAIANTSDDLRPTVENGEIFGFFQVVNGKILFQRGYWDKLSFLKQHNLPIE